MQAVRHVAGLVALVAFLCGLSYAQDAAETAAMASNSAAATQNAKPPTFAATTAPGSAGATASGTKAGAIGSVAPHILAKTGPPLADANRQDFEGNAGPEAAKLLLRSAPSGAQIFINGRLVGRTPLLMMIAPGKYEIEMRGAREESGHRAVGVVPKETRSVMVTLHQKYPSAVTTR